MPREKPSRARKRDRAATLVEVHPWIGNFLYPVMLLGTILCATIRPIMDPDCWFHMALGRHIVEHGRIPKTDLFSYTSAGNEWISSGWLTSLYLHLVYTAGGAWGLSLLVAAFIAVAYLLVYFAGRKWYANSTALVTLLIVCVLASYLRFTPRPSLTTQFFTATLMILLISVERRHASASGPSKRLWLLPILITTWANHHAGFLVGIITIGIFGLSLLLKWVQSHERRYLLDMIPCAVSSVAWLANPYGVRQLALAGKIKSIAGVKERIFEWMPLLDLQNPLPWPSYAGLAALFVLAGIAYVYGVRAATLWRTLAMVFLCALAFYERRHMGLSSIGICALLIPQLPALEQVMRPVRVLIPAGVMVMTIWLINSQAAGVIVAEKHVLSTEIDTSMLPSNATQFMIRNPPPSEMYNTYGAGGYLLYQLGPEQKVFIDGRLDIYDPQVWQDYNDIDSGQMPFEAAAEKYGINTFLVFILGHSSNPNHIALRLSASPDWRITYFDDSYAMFVRNVPANQAYLNRHAYRYVSPLDLARLGPALNGTDQERAEAMTEIYRAIEESRDSAKAHIIAAYMERGRGNEAKAQEHLAKAQKKNPHISLATTQ